MSLQDVKRRDQVLDAIDEYEARGAQDFLAEFGTGTTTSMQIIYVGKPFPAQAVVSAAHKLVTGSPMAGEDLADAAGVGEHLKSLNFTVEGVPAKVRGARTSATRARKATATTRATPVATSAPAQIRPAAWDLDVDEIRTRAQLSASFGGSKFHIIELSPRTRSLMVFASAGQDETRLDGQDPQDDACYLVTGDGRRGDQQWNKSNQALLGHANIGHAVRLFEEVEEGWQPGGTRYRYLGAYAVDTEHPWSTDTAPDADGLDRKVIVFRLRKVPSATLD